MIVLPDVGALWAGFVANVAAFYNSSMALLRTPVGLWTVPVTAGVSASTFYAGQRVAEAVSEAYRNRQ